MHPERGEREGLTPLQKEMRVDLARFLIHNKIPADASDEDQHDVIHFLSKAAEESENPADVRRAERYLARSVARMIALKWITQKGLEAEANVIKHFFDF